MRRIVLALAFVLAMAGFGALNVSAAPPAATTGDMRVNFQRSSIPRTRIWTKPPAKHTSKIISSHSKL